MENDFLKSEFKTSSEGKYEVEKFCRENFHPIFMSKKTTFASYNKNRLKEESKCFDFPENEYTSITWLCKHARRNKITNKESKSKKKTYSTNCKMRLSVVYDKQIKKYFISNPCLEHNHEHGSEVYSKYPDQRIPKGDLKEQVQKLLKLGAKPSKVLDHLHSKGLKTTRQDIQNLKQMCKRQDTDTSMDEILQLFDGKNVLRTNNSNEKKNFKKKMISIEPSNKRHMKNTNKMTKKSLSFNKNLLPQNGRDEGYINHRSEFENEDGCQDLEKELGVNTWIGNKRMKENKMDTEVMSMIKKRKPVSCEDYTNNYKQNNGSIINNLFENRKKLFNMEKLQTETHKEYRTRFEELYEKSKIEEMSMEQLKCFHFTKAYKESEEEDYLRKMTEKMSLNEKTTLEELVQICEEVDQLKTNLMMFNDSLELPSDVRFSGHNHRGQQIRECDCFTCGLTVHWKKDCPKTKNTFSNLEISKSRLLKSVEERRETAGSDRPVIEERQETVGSDRPVIDERYKTNLNWIKENCWKESWKDCSYFGYDTTNVRFDQENVTKLNTNVRFDKVCDKTKIYLKKVNPQNVAVTSMSSSSLNIMPSFTSNNISSYTSNNIPSSTSNNIFNSSFCIPSSSYKSSISSVSPTSSVLVSSFNAYHLASSTPVSSLINTKCYVSSNPHVIRIGQCNPSSSSKPQNLVGLPVSLGNVKGNNIIKNSIDKNNEGFKNIVFIGNKSVSSSGVTSTCVDTLNTSTFKPLTFGTVKINNTPNIKRN